MVRRAGRERQGCPTRALGPVLPPVGDPLCPHPEDVPRAGPGTVRARHRALLRDMRRWDRDVAARYEALLAPKFPKKKLICKSLERLKPEVKKKWRTILREAR